MKVPDTANRAKDLRHKLWELCHRSSDLTSRYVDTILTRETGISYQQFLVLMTTNNTGKTATVGSIAEKLDRTQNTLSVILDRMRKNGLVKKSRNMADRRLVRVILTDKGKQKLEETLKIGWGLIEDLTSSFTEEELRTMLQLMGKLAKSAEERLAVLKEASKIK